MESAPITPALRTSYCTVSASVYLCYSNPHLAPLTVYLQHGPPPTSTVTIQRSLSPARPETSLPARSSLLSVISACLCSSSFCFSFSSYCSFKTRIFSSTYTQMDTHTD